ncbi:MAG: hypothetical protein AAF959_09800 [Cyanobacteria bacterium P01_D01_bin.56]
MDNTYLIAVLSNQLMAENAYDALAEAQMPMQKISILGCGYQSADEFGLIDPDIAADEQFTLLAYWTVPFGFIAGVAFSILLGLQTFAWVGEVGNYLISGLLGAASGGLGAFMVGRLVGWTVGSGAAIAYRNRLSQGKYLIVARGTDELVRRVTQILRQYEPENIQGYSLQGSL